MSSAKALRKALKKALKVEAKACVEKWGDQIKISKGKGESPFPIYVRRTIPQPAAASDFDLAELTVRLYINGLDTKETPVSVRVTTQLPVELKAAVEGNISTAWEATLKATEGQAAWHLVTMLQWVEDSFRQLLGLVPKCLDTYLGVTADGATQRRIAIIEPVVEKVLTEEEKAALAEKEAEEAERAKAYWEAKREEREAEEQKRREADAAEKRRLAEEGLLESKPAKLSKKQLKALADDKKLRKGRRQAKTGPRRRKFVPPEERPSMPAE